MAQPLLSRLSRASRYQLSLGPGRLGWIVTSPLPLEWLRSALARWCTRVEVIHRESGRFFLQPGRAYFSRVLAQREAIAGSGFHDCPKRCERLRRLRPFLAKSGPRQTLGVDLFRALALRLEALAVQQEQDKLWQHMACDFDRLWESVPLYALRLERWQIRVLALLCEPVSGYQEPGRVEIKEALCRPPEF
ncbi:MAG: hypothetical protein WC314_05000 [Vulcanimicrobiota bacterium]